MKKTKVAVVTGGTGGLGEALLKRLSARGYLLAVTYLIPEEAREVEKDLALTEERLMLRRVDATDPEAITNFMKEAVAEFGHIDVVCCLVGGWAGGRDVADTDDVRFERMLDLNLKSAFYTTRAAVPYLKENGSGRIILMGSSAAVETPPDQAAFNMAKAGVVALAKSLAQELRGTDITANVVLPSVIDTPATRASIPYADYVDWPTPDEIAAVIEFLCGDEAGVVSGAGVPVPGNS